MTKAIIGLLLVVLGIVGLILAVAYGVYTALWVCLVGGIVTLIEQCQADTVAALAVAVALVKLSFSTVIGVIVGLLACIPGAVSLGVGAYLLED